MASDTPARPGSSFRTDLRLIREHRGITQQDLHAATRIPVEVIGLFETTGLRDHPSFNAVYLRSFVSEYARQVGIPTEDALDALTASIENRYTGSLAKKHLPDGEAAPAAVPTSPEQASPDEPAAADDPVTSEAETAATPESLLDEPAAAEKPPAEVQTPGLFPPPPTPLQVEEDFDLVEPVISKEDLVTPTRKVTKSEPAPSSLPWPAIVGVIVGIVVLGGIVWALTRGGGTAEPSGEPVPVVTADTLEPDLPAPPALPDTLRIAVIASEGPLLRLQVTRDEQDYTWHWIDEADTLSVAAADRVLLENTNSPALRDASLRLFGQPFPMANQTRVEVTRERARAFMDSVHYVAQGFPDGAPPAGR